MIYYRGPFVYSGDVLEYIAHPEGVVRKPTSSYIYYYAKTDHTGSTRVLCHANGNQMVVDQTTEYYPYGLSYQNENLNLNRNLYSGKELQDQTINGKILGLYDFGSRNYDPVLGRWFNVDPALQFTNPYLYCANSPMMYQDPNGEWVHIVVFAIIGGVVNMITHWESGDIWHNIGAFGIGAAAGAIGGVMMNPAFIAGGGALAGAGAGGSGFLATAFGTTVAGSGGFVAGATAGAASYAASTLPLSFMNSVAYGDEFISGKDFFSGLLLSAAGGGLVNGVTAKLQGNGFVNGKSPYDPVQKPLTPNQKGRMGVERAEKELIEDGHKIVGKEVSYKVEGSNKPGRIDLVTKSPDGQTNFIEVKNGPKTKFTPNQKQNYPMIQNGGQVTTYGKNASPVIGHGPMKVNIIIKKY